MLADRNSKGGRQNRFCLSVTLEQKQTIMHYQPLKSKAFLRITVATPNLVTQTRGLALATSHPRPKMCTCVPTHLLLVGAAREQKGSHRWRLPGGFRHLLVQHLVQHRGTYKY